MILLVGRTPGVFQIDEYFQIVEPASFLLGRTTSPELMWEFKERIRPFLQPAIYAGLGRLAEYAGVKSPFALLWVFRMATGLFSGVASIVAYRSVAPGMRDPFLKTLLAASLALLYFVPFLGVRTSSETVSGALLLMGLALKIGQKRDAARSLVAGLLLGLSIQVRYQAGFAVVGIALHDLVYGPAGRRLRTVLPLAAGVVVTTAIGLAIDAWAYGGFVLTPWNYFKVNLLEGQAATFGTLPFLAYPVLLLLAFPPYGAFLALGLALIWLRRPRHLITWASVPFVVGHSLVGHKEVRFLFPLLLPALLGIFLLFDDEDAERGRGARVLAWLRRAWVHPGVLAIGALGLAGVTLITSPDNVSLQQFVWEHASDDVSFCALTDPSLVHRATAPFVLPPPGFKAMPVSSLNDLEECANEGDRPVVVLGKYPLPKGVEPWLEARGERVFSALPAFLSKLDFNGWVGRADLTVAYRLPRPATKSGVR